MVLKFEDLRVLKAAETVADDVWRRVMRWETFARDVVGKQLARAIDSVGANIAEAYGRFHYGEKLQFLYYARGSLFEAKYWLNRSLKRNLISSEQIDNYTSQVTDLARQINSFASDIKTLRSKKGGRSKTISEESPKYITDWIDAPSTPLFDEEELKWLRTTPDS